MDTVRLIVATEPPVEIAMRMSIIMRDNSSITKSSSMMTLQNLTPRNTKTKTLCNPFLGLYRAITYGSIPTN